MSYYFQLNFLNEEEKETPGFNFSWYIMAKLFIQ